MIKYVFVCLLITALGGCVSTEPLSENSPGVLNTANAVEKLEAVVVNPYPECKEGEVSKRIADLEAKRGERVYL